MNKRPNTNERLVNDHARKMGGKLLGLVAHNYREETHHDIWEAFVDVCREGILEYHVELRRLDHRLRPGSN